MSDINSVVLSGRLTRDSEITYVNNSIPILKFGLANNRRIKRNNEWIDYAQFFDCVLFGSRAERLIAFLLKGKQVVVNGSLRYESWDDKRTGDKRSKSSILVDEIQILSPLPALRAPNKVNSDEGFHEDIPF
ncbi:single-stranded DNA-binding protein [Borrelia hermsii]|uniref:Single-stranded DNA-binding protein n=2 Tax=Borrelia hermsii TaxID=140 RepID=Q9KKD0_BORHE|nr:single-stranded DNA-binding protein [Borrelia hermsii]AAF28877.1 putative single-stranded DNA-binding protein [Borrelia hermsii]ANA43832.1 Single-stranded DNA binding protein [Borrelia hermsii HS1]